MLDIRQTPRYANYLRKIGWMVKNLEGINYFIKKLPFVGSVIKIQRPEIISHQAIESLNRKHQPFQIIVEPKNRHQELIIKNLKFKMSKNPFLPTKTLRLDLAKSEKELLKRMKKDCRSAINMNHKLRTMNYELNHLKIFRQSWKKTVGWKRHVPPLSHLEALKKAFGKNSLFITNKQKSGGAVFLKTKKIAYYWQAFTNFEGRRHKIQYRLVWKGILWAKKSGCRYFDFEGIYDERFPNKSWVGFSHFKKSFGGYEVKFPGCYLKKTRPFFLSNKF